MWAQDEDAEERRDQANGLHDRLVVAGMSLAQQVKVGSQVADVLQQSVVLVNVAHLLDARTGVGVVEVIDAPAAKRRALRSSTAQRGIGSSLKRACSPAISKLSSAGASRQA